MALLVILWKSDCSVGFNESMKAGLFNRQEIECFLWTVSVGRKQNLEKSSTRFWTLRIANRQLQAQLADNAPNLDNGEVVCEFFFSIPKHNIDDGE